MQDIVMNFEYKIDIGTLNDLLFANKTMSKEYWQIHSKEITSTDSEFLPNHELVDKFVNFTIYPAFLYPTIIDNCIQNDVGLVKSKILENGYEFEPNPKHDVLLGVFKYNDKTIIRFGTTSMPILGK